MPRDYLKADEAQALAEKTVIPKWHQDLADAAICYLEDSENMKMKGKYILAKIRKATNVENHLTGHDLVLIISGPAWRSCTDEQKLALLDHEFCHVEKIVREDGTEVLSMVGHDLEEFRAVVRRHGVWHVDIEMFKEDMQKSLDLQPVA